MAGWIKLHRKTLDSKVFQNEKLLKTFVWCLLKASHKEYEFFHGRQKISLRPGQFITGRKKAGEELDMPPSTAWFYLNLLKADSTIDIKSNNKYSLITLINWGLYQSDGDNFNSNLDSNLDNKRTTNGQQTDTYKNNKNDKKDLIYVLTADENNFLDTLATIENYPLDRKRDLKLYQTLAERYPQLDLIAAIEQWAAYKLDKPLNGKSNPRSQINTAFKKYLEWGKCLKERSAKSGAPERHPAGSDPAGKYRKFVKS
jgi:hypothetical protein